MRGADLVVTAVRDGACRASIARYSLSLTLPRCAIVGTFRAFLKQ